MLGSSLLPAFLKVTRHFGTHHRIVSFQHFSKTLNFLIIQQEDCPLATRAHSEISSGKVTEWGNVGPARVDFEDKPLYKSQSWKDLPPFPWNMLVLRPREETELTQVTQKMSGSFLSLSSTYGGWVGSTPEYSWLLLDSRVRDWRGRPGKVSQLKKISNKVTKTIARFNVRSWRPRPWDSEKGDFYQP